VPEAYLGLGGNIGNVEAQIRAALRALRQPPIIEVIACSSLYRTEPVGGPPGQPDFQNAAVQVETSLSPEELLKACLDVEAALGRVRAERFGPRTIDIDLLLYEDLTMASEELTVPHPRLRDRLFALVPLAEIAPAELALPPDRTPLRAVLAGALNAEGLTLRDFERKIALTAAALCT